MDENGRLTFVVMRGLERFKLCAVRSDCRVVPRLVHVPICRPSRKLRQGEMPAPPSAEPPQAFLFLVFFLFDLFLAFILKMPGEFKISAEDWVKGACMATAGGVAMNRLGMSEIAAFYLQSRRL